MDNLSSQEKFEILVQQIKSGETLQITKYIKSNGDINYLDRYNQSLLHWAVYHDSIYNVGVLIEYGANINITRNEGGTPLHLSVAFTRVEIAEYLLEHNANFNLKNQQGYTVLDLLYEFNDPVMVGVFEDYFANLADAKRPAKRTIKRTIKEQ